MEPKWSILGSQTMISGRGRLKVEAPPIVVCKYVDLNGSNTILATKRSAGVTPEVNLVNSLLAGNEACE